MVVRNIILMQDKPRLHIAGQYGNQDDLIEITSILTISYCGIKSRELARKMRLEQEKL